MTEIECAQELLQVDVVRVIVLARRKGASIRAIANTFGESKSTMHRWVQGIERAERLLSQEGQEGVAKPRIGGGLDGALSHLGQQ